MSIGIAYNPCKSCKEMDKCSICELTYYKKGCIKSPASEVAREIFEEIEHTARAAIILLKFERNENIKNIKTEYYTDLIGYIAELKKKYMEV